MIFDWLPSDPGLERTEPSLVFIFSDAASLDGLGSLVVRYHPAFAAQLQVQLRAGKLKIFPSPVRFSHPSLSSLLGHCHGSSYTHRHSIMQHSRSVHRKGRDKTFKSLSDTATAPVLTLSRPWDSVPDYEPFRHEVVLTSMAVVFSGCYSTCPITCLS